MRGLAVLAAALAGWVVGGGRLPVLRRPRMRLPSVPALLIAALGGSLTALVVLGITGAPAVAGASGGLGALGPLWVTSLTATRRRAAVAERWPDVLASVRSRIGGGASLQEAFTAAARPAGPPFDEAADHVEEATRAGGGFIAAVDELRPLFDDAIADRVLTTLAAAHRAGGHRVGVILASLGASVADEIRLRKAHVAALTQQRLTATVALVAPWLLLVLTVATNPQAASAYHTSEGGWVIVAGFAATVTGYLLARRTARLAEPPRILR